MKKCSACKEEKELSEYYYERGKPVYRCKECHKKSSRAYYQKHKKNILAFIRMYNKELKESE